MRFLQNFGAMVRLNLVPLCIKKTRRSEAVAVIVECITKSCTCYECPDSVKFIAGQVVSDMEEIFCADQLADSPFFYDEVISGYGGKQGFSIFDGESAYIKGKTSKRVRNSGRIDVNDQEQLAQVCNKVLDYIQTQLTNDDLCQMGLEKVDIDGAPVVVVKLSGRSIFSVDVDHMMCKVYLAVAAYRGSRSCSVPSPWRAHCHLSLIHI